MNRILAYETLSETEFAVYPELQLNPNIFVEITGYLDRKLEVLSIYGSEIGDFPFPRSREAVTALAHMRGSTAGFQEAEAFQLLRQFDAVNS